MISFAYYGARALADAPLLIASEVVQHIEAGLDITMPEDVRTLLLVELDAAASRADTQTSSFMAARILRQELERIASLMAVELSVDLAPLLEEAVCSPN